MLNLPNSINKKLEAANNILIVGAGGGQDVLVGLPLYYTFLKQGKKPHLANLTHTDFSTIKDHAEPIILDSCLLGATSMIKEPSTNYVESYLSNFFKVSSNSDVTVWMFNRTHVLELKKAFSRLIEHLKIDAIVLVDGGIDSIMKGDEGNDKLTNNFLNTTLILSVLQSIESFHDKCLSMACSDISNVDINEQISLLSSQGGFYGGCFMVGYMNSYKLMSASKLYINKNENIDVDKKVISCLFFNPIALAYNNILTHKILELNSYNEIMQVVMPYIQKKN